MNQLPKDPVMLLSVVNTNLRDYYKNLDDFCESKEVDREEIIKTIAKINYKYNSEKNQFV
jgi:hypothetical protein